jgi:hypothetical protein
MRLCVLADNLSETFKRPLKKGGYRNSKFEVRTVNQGMYEKNLSVSAAANEGAVMIPPEHLGAYPKPSLVLLCYAKLSEFDGSYKMTPVTL